MMNDNIVFYLMLNSEGKTEWNPESIRWYNNKLDELLNKNTGYVLSGETGAYRLIRFTSDLKNNRIKVESEITIRYQYCDAVSDLFGYYMYNVIRQVKEALKDNSVLFEDTAIFWYNADTIIYDDDPIEGQYYNAEVLYADYGEAKELFEKLAAE